MVPVLVGIYVMSINFGSIACLKKNILNLNLQSFYKMIYKVNIKLKTHELLLYFECIVWYLPPKSIEQLFKRTGLDQ